MVLNWNLLNAPNPADAFNEGFNQARQSNAIRALSSDPSNQNALADLMSIDPRTGIAFQQMATQQAERERLAQERATMRQAGSLYASGDKEGARKAAISSGNFELANQFLQLDENTQKLVAQKYKSAAPVALKAAELPYEQRRQFIMAAAPALLAQGWTQEEIAGFDPNDQALQGLAASAMTVEQVLDSGKVKWVTGEWGAFATDSMGRPVSPGFAGQPQAAPMPAQAPQAQQPGNTDQIFAAMIQTESGGQQFGQDGQPLTSPAGAIGIAQVMPQTAPEAAALAGVPFDARRYRTDPEYNALLGRAYFEKQLQDFGDPALAVAAYNAGPGRIRAALKRGGANWQAHIPQETRQYIQSVLGPTASGTQTAALSSDAMPSIQQQAASGVIQAGQKPPPGYEWADAGRTALRPIPNGPGDKSQENAIALRKEAADVRREFMSLPQVKKFHEVRQSTLQIKELATSVPDNSPGRAQADLALIFSFMKALDPGSTVREGEFATAQNAAGIPDRIRNLYNQSVSGQKLNTDQRMGMVRAAEDVYRTSARTYNEIARQYHPLLETLGVENPKAIAPIAVAGDEKPNRAAAQPQSAGQPVTGQIRIISREKVR